MIDIQKALINPASIFKHPQEVVSHSQLTRDQKIEILRRWAYDEKELETASDENMSGFAEDQLNEVLKALHDLGAGLMKG